MLPSKTAFENSLLKVCFSAYKADSGLKVILRLYKAFPHPFLYIKQKGVRESNSCISGSLEGILWI